MEASVVSLIPPELRRLAVVERVVAGDLTQVAGAPLLRLSLRQFKRSSPVFAETARRR
jgi:hypothetical protein